MGREEAGRSRPPTPRVRRVLAGEGGEEGGGGDGDRGLD
jgi:hypothetical protein